MEKAINDLSAFCRTIKQQDASAIENGAMLMIAPELIEEEVGFNLRDYDRQDTVEHIEKLCSAYTEGEQMPPLMVKVVGGRLFVRDGHCRLRAIRLAMSRGVPIRRVPVIEVKGNREQSDLLLLTSNSGLKLTPVQLAKGYARLKNYGYSSVEIGKRIGLSDTHVRETIRILETPTELQRMIENYEIAAHVAMKLWREKGDEAVTFLRNAKNSVLAAQVVPDIEDDDVEERSTEGIAEEPKVRLTSKQLSGGGARRSPKLFDRMSEGYTHVHRHLSQAKVDENAGVVAVVLPIDIYNTLMEISEQVK